MSPPTSASQHALPAASSMAPRAPMTARPVASTNMPMVASVRGGCTGCPGSPCSSAVAFDGRGSVVSMPSWRRPAPRSYRSPSPRLGPGGREVRKRDVGIGETGVRDGDAPPHHALEVVLNVPDVHVQRRDHVVAVDPERDELAAGGVAPKDHPIPPSRQPGVLHPHV